MSVEQAPLAALAGERSLNTVTGFARSAPNAALMTFAEKKRRRSDIGEFPEVFVVLGVTPFALVD